MNASTPFLTPHAISTAVLKYPTWNADVWNGVMIFGGGGGDAVAAAEAFAEAAAYGDDAYDGDGDVAIAADSYGCTKGVDDLSSASAVSSSSVVVAVVVAVVVSSSSTPSSAAAARTRRRAGAR